MQRHKWILLAEDNILDADLTLRALQAGDATTEVVIARDGVDALDCLYRRNGFTARPEHDPAVIFLDLKMPRLDGMDVLEQVKKDERFKYIPVVIFSSSREECDLSRCYKLGANAYVVKPVNFKKFMATLRELGSFWTMMNIAPPQSCPPGTANGRVAFGGMNGKKITPLSREKTDSHLAA